MNPRIEKTNGLFAIVMRWESNEDLRWMIDPDAPWVWLPSYEDRSLHHWHKAVLPSHPSHLGMELRYSSPLVDMLLPTKDFLGALSGLRLCLQQIVCQTTKRVPDSLRYEKVQGTSLYPVLVENGLHLHILLTNDDEALVTSPSVAALERLLKTEPLPPRVRGR